MQECDWQVPTQKMTDLTREIRNIGLGSDGYMNFKDIMHGIRKSKGLRTWEDLKPAVCEDYSIYVFLCDGAMTC